MLSSPRGRPSSARRAGRRRTAAAAAAITAALVVVCPSSAAGRVSAAEPPPPVPRGIGDRLFPYLGNPGYDVTAYDIAFRYHGNDRPLDAVTTLDARATAPLRSFNLDFTHGTVRSVWVDGRPARFTGAGEDLVITPARPVRGGASFQVTLEHTSDPSGNSGGWIRTHDGLAMANQADAAHRVFPCNDHPSDKARFTFSVTAPKNLTVVANGKSLGRSREGDNVTWRYRLVHPMATELAQISIGRSTVLHRTGPGGLPVRDVVPAADSARLAKWPARTPGQLEWMEKKVGPYPFETYGVLIAKATTGFELETQTLSLFERGLFTTSGLPPWYIESIMVHELAHQWFGDSVSPRRWSDLWLNEGHATWYEALYGDERGKMPLDKRMRLAYGQSDAWRASGGPPAAPLPSDPDHQIGIFRPIVYDGSALVLYALRQRIGRAAFERLERRWVHKYRDGVASTADFVRLASEVAGRDLTGFLRPWLYGRTTPKMPGHPDWRPDVRSSGRAMAKADGKANRRAYESAGKPG